MRGDRDTRFRRISRELATSPRTRRVEFPDTELDAGDLMRLSYLPRGPQFSAAADLGYSVDQDLTTPETAVLRDPLGKPVIVHRGSASAKDWLLSDVAIGAGKAHHDPRQREARRLTEQVQRKYGRAADALGHSLGGRLAEQSGAGGRVITFNKAAGPMDLAIAPANGARQLDMRVPGDVVSALSNRTDRRIERRTVAPVGRGGIAGAHSLANLPSRRSKNTRTTRS